MIKTILETVLVLVLVGTLISWLRARREVRRMRALLSMLDELDQALNRELERSPYPTEHLNEARIPVRSAAGTVIPFREATRPTPTAVGVVEGISDIQGARNGT